MLVSHLKPIVYKILLGILGFFIILIFLEFSWFYFVLQKDSKEVAADAVVVFGGSHDRTVKGFAFVNDGLAPFIIISPASVKHLWRFDKTYRKKDSYKYLIEDRAETTFQNAVLVADLIQKHDLTSVVLVTNAYHMPRSAFLLKIQLLGRGVPIRLCPVEVGRFGRNPLAWSGIQKKLVYNEMVQLWGSLAEMGHYRMTERLPEKGAKRNKAISWLRSVLLFEVSQS